MTEFPGIPDPTWRDRLGVDLAQTQLEMILDLRALRETRGLTVEQVAEDMRATVAAVEWFETPGSNPTWSMVRAYAKAVGAQLAVTVHKHQEQS